MTDQYIVGSIFFSPPPLFFLVSVSQTSDGVRRLLVPASPVKIVLPDTCFLRLPVRQSLSVLIGLAWSWPSLIYLAYFLPRSLLDQWIEYSILSSYIFSCLP